MSESADRAVWDIKPGIDISLHVDGKGIAGRSGRIRLDEGEPVDRISSDVCTAVVDKLPCAIGCDI
jgi:hypothetical protein